MSTSLLVLALLVALVSVPTVAGLTAWGLAGGDGSPDNAILGLLGALVGYGAMYNAVVTFRAFWWIPDWAWWLMWVPAAAGLLGILVGRHELAGSEPSSAWDWLVGVGMQLSLAVPAGLVWAAGVAP